MWSLVISNCYCDIFFPIGHYLEKSDIGFPKHECLYCGALYWNAQCIKDSSSGQIKIYPLCCKKDRIKLPFLQPTPPFLDALLSNNKNPLLKNFKENIRMYNCMFSFPSMGGKIDSEINKKIRTIYFQNMRSKPPHDWIFTSCQW